MKKNMEQVVLNGETRHLYYNLNSFELIEELTGQSIDSIGDNLSMKNLKALIYAGLVHEDKNLTLDDVGNMIGMEDIKPVSDAIGRCMGGLA